MAGSRLSGRLGIYWIVATGVAAAWSATLPQSVQHAMAGRSGAAVVMDVESGKILAADGLETAARVLVRPGSTLKPFTLLALLEAGKLKSGESLRCERTVRLEERHLDCTHAGAAQSLNAVSALAYSCNFYFAQMALRLDGGNLPQTVRRAGLISPTGLVAGEASGSVETTRDPVQRQLQAIGEAHIQVTPLALLAAYRKLALRRKRHDPHYEELFAGLEACTTYGTGRMARPDGMDIAGKTGTSTTSLAPAGRHAWFVGYAPAAVPKIALLVYLNGGRGGYDAAPVAKEIFAAARPLIETGGNGGQVTVRPYWIERRGSQVAPISMSMDDYVAAVLAGEGPVLRSNESLTAMAIVVRSYATYFRGRHKAEGFDFCDTTHCQDYRRVGVTERLLAAVGATSGQVLTFDGSTAATYYHRSCGGMTEAAHLVWPGQRAAYLIQHTDAYCQAAGRDEWRSVIPKDSLRQALGETKIESLRVVDRSPSGRAQHVRLEGADSKPVVGSTFRFAVGRVLGWDRIRSDLYEVRDTGQTLVFHGYGAGHGVGLCQTGAARMGEQGHGYAEILAYYFPGTALSSSNRPTPPEWHALGGERVEVLTISPKRDTSIIGKAERMLRELENGSALRLTSRPRIKVYPTVAAFRDDTGEPGWVAGSTRGHTIRLQPAAGDGVLRHELAHLLVESNAAARLPLWFREGVALYLSGEGGGQPASGVASLDRALQSPRSAEELRTAYAAARERVSRLVRKHGRETVLSWIKRGLPEGAS